MPNNEGSAGAGRDGKLREILVMVRDDRHTCGVMRGRLNEALAILALAVPDPLASDTGQGERPTLAQALERQVAMALRASEMAGMKPDEKAFYEGKAAGIRQALNSVRISASAPLASSSETQRGPRCRDCADGNGTCWMDGSPCDSSVPVRASGAKEQPVVWANEATPMTGPEVLELLSENERLRRDLTAAKGRVDGY